ncbi:MAG: hypothetical protein KDD89_06080 [Anaerolineales bacterium]|nr:hypothetical protein [Anaerolineales bacterium]
MTNFVEQSLYHDPSASGASASGGPSNRKKRAKRRRRHTSPDTPTYANVLKQFVACGQCSTLIVGYRLLHGVAALEQAIANQQDGWMTLVWDKQTRLLLTQSYDVLVEGDSVYFDFCCPECQRRFSYRENPDGTPAETFLVDLKL